MRFKCDGCVHYSMTKKKCNVYKKHVKEITAEECTGYGYASNNKDSSDYDATIWSDHAWIDDGDLF